MAFLTCVAVTAEPSLGRWPPRGTKTDKLANEHRGGEHTSRIPCGKCIDNYPGQQTAAHVYTRAHTHMHVCTRVSTQMVYVHLYMIHNRHAIGKCNYTHIW